MTLIVNMVVKNESDRYLSDVLQVASSFADKIVVTDDASTDNTVEIVSEYTDIIYRNENSMFSTHEGQLRQGAWNNLSNHATKGDWIFCLDADEIVDFSRCVFPMSKLLGQTRFQVLGVKFYHMWNMNQYRTDKAWKPTIGSRLFRFNNTSNNFKDWKVACGSEPVYVQELIRNRSFLANTGIHVKHLGYAKDEDKKMKYDRYMKIDKGDFHSLQHIKSIIDENPTLIGWEERE